MLVRTVCVIVIAAALSAPVPSWADEAGDPQAAFDSGKLSFRQGDFAAALAWFEQARAAGLGGPAVYFNIGVCHYKLGAYAPARTAFEQVAKVPSMAALAHYNLGLVALKLDQSERAVEHFTLAARSGDTKLRALASYQLDRLRPEPEYAAPSRTVEWVAFASLQAGYDENVALVNEDLPTAGDQVDSTFSEVFAALSGRRLWGSGFGLDGSAYLSSFADAGAYDQVALRLGGHYRHDGETFWAEFGAHYASATLDSDVYEQKWIASARLRWPLGGGSYLEGLLSHEQIEAGAAQFEYLEGSRQKATLRGVQQWGRYALRGDYTYEANDRLDAGVSPQRHRVDLRCSARVGSAWLVELGASWRDSRYDELQPAREETLLTLGLRVNWDLGDAWQVYAEYNQGDNDSSDDNYTYQRAQGFIGLSWVR